MFETMNFAPLPASMLAISIIGFILVAIYNGILGLSWTFALGLFFLVMFFASYLSLHYAPLVDRDILDRKYRN